MRYFYDCEFLEDGATIELLTLGMRAGDGRTLYHGSIEADWGRVSRHPWLVENVLPQLPGQWVGSGWLPVDEGTGFWRSRAFIRDEVSEFIRRGSAVEARAEHELWGYYAAYDHVALCQLFGRMVDLPPWVPMYTNDLMQAARIYGIDRLDRMVPQPTDEHHALADALWDEQAWKALKAHAEQRGYFRRSPLDLEV